MKDGSETVLPRKRSTLPVSQRADTMSGQKAVSRGQWQLALGQRKPGYPTFLRAKNSPAAL